MSMLSLLCRMAENNACSNRRLYRACAALSAEAFAERRTSFFPSLPQTLEHILLVDRFYRAAVEHGENDPSVYEDEGKLLAFEVLQRAQAEEDLRLVRVVRALDDGALSRKVIVHWRAGTKEEQIGDVLPHLFVHQIHHRGQVHAMLSGTAVKPPQLDEFFLEVDRPSREAAMKELGLE